MYFSMLIGYLADVMLYFSICVHCTQVEILQIYFDYFEIKPIKP